MHKTTKEALKLAPVVIIAVIEFIEYLKKKAK
jgi:hypothetical protein